jgi:beta-alanine degradation protein BauB
MTHAARPQAIPNVQIYNDRIIVTEWRFPPGAETGWHIQSHNYIVIPQTSGSLELQTHEGTKIVQLHAGQSYARHIGIQHNVINPTNNEIVFIEVEVL